MVEPHGKTLLVVVEQIQIGQSGEEEQISLKAGSGKEHGCYDGFVMGNYYGHLRALLHWEE